jgi:hypothetical protein
LTDGKKDGFMKKLPVTVIILFMAASAVGAQQFAVGGRLGALFGLHGFTGGNFLFFGLEGVPADYSIDTEKSKTNINFAVYGLYAFSDRFALQAELNFMLNQGMKLSGFYEESEDDGFSYNYILTGTYSSLDIPVLINFTVIGRPFLLGLIAGSHFSIPIGKFETSYSRKDHSDAGSFDIDGITLGATGGIFAGFPAGPGNIVADIRFVFDFNELKKIGGMAAEFGRRRGIAATLGYEFVF